MRHGRQRRRRASTGAAAGRGRPQVRGRAVARGSRAVRWSPGRDVTGMSGREGAVRWQWGAGRRARGSESSRSTFGRWRPGWSCAGPPSGRRPWRGGRDPPPTASASRWRRAGRPWRGWPTTCARRPATRRRSPTGWSRGGRHRGRGWRCAPSPCSPRRWSWGRAPTSCAPMRRGWPVPWPGWRSPSSGGRRSRVVSSGVVFSGTASSGRGPRDPRDVGRLGRPRGAGGRRSWDRGVCRGRRSSSTRLPSTCGWRRGSTPSSRQGVSALLAGVASGPTSRAGRGGSPTGRGRRPSGSSTPPCAVLWPSGRRRWPTSRPPVRGWGAAGSGSSRCRHPTAGRPGWSSCPARRSGHRRAGRNPFDLTTDVRAVTGEATVAAAGVVAAVDLARSRSWRSAADDPVLLVGHSQGGILAAALADDPGFVRRHRVTHVVTSGAPVGVFPVPEAVRVLSVQHADDPVHRLDLTPNPARSSWVTVRAPAAGPPVDVRRHGLETDAADAAHRRGRSEGDRRGGRRVPREHRGVRRRAGALGDRGRRLTRHRSHGRGWWQTSRRNLSSALARVLVDGLSVVGCVTSSLSPGSRSAPLAYALLAAEQAGRCGSTSGSTSAPPASSPSGSPRGRDAPSRLSRRRGPRSPTCTPPSSRPTTRPCRSSSSVPRASTSSGGPAPTRRPSSRGSSAAPCDGRSTCPPPWSDRASGRSGAARSAGALAAATGAVGPQPGPVHLDVCFREPLVPDAAPAPGAAEDTGTADWPDSLGGRRRRRAVCVDPTARTSVTPIEEVARTLVVIGSTSDPSVAADAVVWAAERGHPVVAEPFGLARVREGALPHWSAPPHRDGLARPPRPRPGRRRRPGDPLAGGRCPPTPPRPAGRGRLRGRRRVPSHVAAAAHAIDALRAPVDLDALDRAAGDRWADEWASAATVLARGVEEAPAPWPSGLAVAATLGAALPELAVLVVGSSNPARDLDLGVATSVAADAVANRGLAGIDGIADRGRRRPRPGRRAGLRGDGRPDLPPRRQRPPPRTRRAAARPHRRRRQRRRRRDLQHPRAGCARAVGRLRAGLRDADGTDLAALCAAHGVPTARRVGRGAGPGGPVRPRGCASSRSASTARPTGRRADLRAPPRRPRP